MRIRVISMLGVEIISDVFIKSVKSIRGAVIVADRMIRTCGFTDGEIDAVYVIALASNEIKYIDMILWQTKGEVVRKKIYYDSSERRHCCCYEENGKN